MSKPLRCFLGFHDWSEFGDCARCAKVRTTPADYVEGLGHLLAGTDWRGPWTRVAERKYEAKREAGRRLQGQLAALGADVSLELCVWYARERDTAESLLRLAEDRAAQPSQPEGEKGA
jgi:hypothetical protein